ncbi:hypothetical protein [Sporomusa sp.]|uniref:hypothetical protein n=1 Tax=Sporomusa sp. TaxID=2078658 RepID=UPI002C548B3E|nr:hypothetical protein [Sporomusa sp.]HWR43971.1 hypothetical protein [Sporomusa sp.]
MLELSDVSIRLLEGMGSMLAGGFIGRLVILKFGFINTETKFDTPPFGLPPSKNTNS